MFLVFLVMFSYLTSGFPIDRCQVMPRRCSNHPWRTLPCKTHKGRPGQWQYGTNKQTYSTMESYRDASASLLPPWFKCLCSLSFHMNRCTCDFFLQSVNPSGGTVPWWSQCVNVPSPWFRSWIKNCPLHLSCLSSASSDDWLASSMISWQSW